MKGSMMTHTAWACSIDGCDKVHYYSAAECPDCKSLQSEVVRLQGDLDSALELLSQAVGFVKVLADDEECRFDHHGGCQAHGRFELNGQPCPDAEAVKFVPVAEYQIELLKEADHE